MNLLELLKKVTIKLLNFHNHPCIEMEESIQIHYINALTLVAISDNDISALEIEYIKLFIDSFGLSPDLLDTFIEFGKNPDKKIVLDMMQSINNKNIRYNLLVDCMMMAYIDGDYNDKEKTIIKQYYTMFKIDKDEADDLESIFYHFYHQNSYIYLDYIDIELFRYLFDYYDMEM